MSITPTARLLAPDTDYLSVMTARAIRASMMRDCCGQGGDDHVDNDDNNDDVCTTIATTAGGGGFNNR